MSRKLKIVPDELIAEYRAAYFEANGRPIFVSYNRGWYQLGTGGYQARYRGRQVQYMAAELRNRVARAALLPTPMTKGTDA